MNGRFGAAIVAFALAAAFVSRAPLLPEFLVQLRDPNLLGGPLFSAALKTFGYAFILGLCGALCACTILLAAWRARVRGATDWHATLVAALVALCMASRAGVSLDPIGWLCAAAVCLLLERDDDTSGFELIAVIAAWSLLQGGATLGSMLVLCALIGKLTDDGSFAAEYRTRAIQYGLAILFGVLQLHALPWHAYGAHALYLDSIHAGAQRDRLWNGDVSAAAIGFCGIIVVAAWYGLRRRGRMTDAVTFFALLVLTLIDARMLPYFGIVAAPVAVDALASYYVLARSKPRGSALRYTPAVLAACALFIAGVLTTEPAVRMWPNAVNQPAELISHLRTERVPLRILCTKPRWCDGIATMIPNARIVADDRAGITPRLALRVEFAVATASAGWRQMLSTDSVNAVIASQDDAVTSLLTAAGWRVRADDGARVLLQR